MPRYFLEVAYKGSNYSGFQSQANTGDTIQSEIEKAFEILHKSKVIMSGSSRTDAGVHALQNYFHFDFDGTVHPQFIYKINAILPGDIVVKNVTAVAADAHCRYDALSREYRYFIYRKKNPFLADRAFFFPYKLDIGKMQQAAALLKEYNDFTSFSKRNTQVKSFICELSVSEWLWESGRDGDSLVYHVRGNRFLRGMVRALTATMLKVGRDKMSLEEFEKVIRAKDCTKASFSAPAHGLFLVSVQYPAGYFS